MPGAESQLTRKERVVTWMRSRRPHLDHERWKASIGVGTPEDVVGPLLFLLSDAATMTASLLSRDLAYPVQVQGSAVPRWQLEYPAVPLGRWGGVQEVVELSGHWQ